jgi:hypothetical protein
MHETGFISRLFDGGDIRVVQTANKFKRNWPPLLPQKHLFEWTCNNKIEKFKW